MSAHRSKAETLAAMPPCWPEDVREQILELLRPSRRKLVVLDDDPTGTQTVYGIAVVTEWSVETLRSELASDAPGFYILTNSRSLPAEEAAAMNRKIAENLQTAATELGLPRELVCVVSRSDSTLRGHFPVETDVLGEVLGPFDATFIVPFFEDGGRYTIDDVHYVAQEDALVPAAETPFAKDAVFGYRSSNLRDWVAEKTAGRVPAEGVESIRIDEMRRGGPAAVCRRLRQLPPGCTCIVNAAESRDLDVFALAVLQVEAEGRRYLFRSAASLVSARLGLARRPLLSPEELVECDSHRRAGGLTVVGSYVPKTTEQLQRLLQRPGIEPVEVDVETLLDPARSQVVLQETIGRVNSLLGDARDVVLFTSRKLIAQADAATNLQIGRTVSDALVEVVRGLECRPRYLIAKGGVTSSDVATAGLGVRRAMVLGQLLPGVPVWELGDESRYPGLRYVVFPGNVGGPDALAQATAVLCGRGLGRDALP